MRPVVDLRCECESKYARAATIFRWPDVYDPTFTVEEK